MSSKYVIKAAAIVYVTSLATSIITIVVATSSEDKEWKSQKNGIKYLFASIT